MKTMKLLLLSAAAGSLFFLTGFTGKSIVAYTKITHTPAGKGFAVLELFTSEGCSSCPAADVLLASIQQNAAGKPVFALAYHVDYWDRLGWKDPFSSHDYSQRQYEYSNQFTGQVYTPQLVINGSSEYVGSDAPAITRAVDKSMAGAAAIQLNMQAQTNNNHAQVSYTITGATSNEQLVIAVVQKKATSKVMHGENEGRTLLHAQIVRDLHSYTVSANHKGTVQFTLPGNFNQQDWELIGLLQSPDTRVITAATRSGISNSVK